MNITDKIFKFFGGIKPEGHKQISTRNPIKRLPLSKELIIPIRQHVGKMPNIVVKIGDRVLKGQILAEPVANMSAATSSRESGLSGGWNPDGQIVLFEKRTSFQ